MEIFNLSYQDISDVLGGSIPEGDKHVLVCCVWGSVVIKGVG